jgi:peptidoglycan/LPS O-acetylase OafA/YrhL
VDRHGTFLGTARFGSLDGLRALSIVPVIWHHATPRPLDGVLGRGPLGVDLFFAISGFLITTLLVRERASTDKIALGAFYARRSLRIFPLYYLVLGLFVLHALLLREPGPVRSHFLASVPFYVTYTSNWFVDWRAPHPIVFAFAWSLATEEQFYLFWPWLLRARRLVVPALAMATLVLLDQGAERGWIAGAELPLRMLRSFATPIGLGALLALAMHHGPSFRLLATVLARRWSSVAALVLVVLAAVDAWPLLVTHFAMVALVGAACAREDHALAPVLGTRALRHVGTVSYGMYLLNVPVVAAARHLSPRTEVVFVLGLVGTIAVATLAYRLVEKPLLSLRERLRPQRSLSGASFHSVSSGRRAPGPDCLTTLAHSSTVSRRGPNGEESEASESMSSVGVSTP